MTEYIKCETCLYNKNCQFLAKHRNTIVEDCSVYKNAADVVEVVRCKNCSFAKPNYLANGLCLCERPIYDRSKGEIPMNIVMTEDDFCSCGERMDLE